MGSGGKRGRQRELGKLNRRFTTEKECSEEYYRRGKKHVRLRSR